METGNGAVVAVQHLGVHAHQGDVTPKNDRLVRGKGGEPAPARQRKNQHTKAAGHRYTPCHWLIPAVQDRLRAVAGRGYHWKSAGGL